MLGQRPDRDAQPGKYGPGLLALYRNDIGKPRICACYEMLSMIAAAMPNALLAAGSPA
jgi:hypothetical protein